jgi:uncharacterized protein
MTLVLPAILGLVALTSFFSGIFGVAGGMMLMGGLVYLLPVSQAMLVHGLAQFISNGTRVVLWRQHIDVPIVLRFLAGSAICIVAFIFIRLVPSKPLVLFILGASTLIMYAVPKRWAPKITQPAVSFLCGLIAAGLMLTSGVSGTFVDQFFVRTDLDRRKVVATKAMMQTFLHAVKIAYFGTLAATSAFDDNLLVIFLCVPLVAVVASRLGGLVLERMSDKQFYWWIQRIVFCLGVYYVLDALRLWFLAA